MHKFKPKLMLNIELKKVKILLPFLIAIYIWT